MKMNSSTQRLREDFEAQFEPRGDGLYLYRRNQRGEPIPVSAQERDDFVGQYGRRVRNILRGMMGALLAFLGVVIAWSVSANMDVPEIMVTAGIVLIAAVAIGAMYWVRAAPARELEGRSSVGRERSKEEMRAIYFNKISYGHLASAAIAGVLLVASQASTKDVFSGWHRIWLVLGMGLVLLAAVQAFRKWLFENQ